jgi:hypothetical protein
MARRRPGGAPQGIPARLEPIVVATWHPNDEGPFDEPLTAAEETEHIRALFDAQYPVGTLTGDLTRFLEAEYFGLDQWQAATALAQHRRFMPTSQTDVAAGWALRRLIGERGREATERYLRDKIYPEALVLAFKHAEKPQTIRLGGIGWLKDSKGRRLPFRPRMLESLTNRLLSRWLRKEAMNEAERLLLDGDRVVLPQRIPFCGDKLPPDGAPFFGEQRLSEADQTVLRMQGSKATHAEVGRALGISRPAAKQRAYRLRHRRPR